MGDSKKRYKDLTKTNAKFFGGASLVNPDAPAQIFKKAKAFATGTANKRSPSKVMNKLMEGWNAYLLQEAHMLEPKYALILKIEPHPDLDSLISKGQQYYSDMLPEGEEFTKIDISHLTLIPGKIFDELDDDEQHDIVERLGSNENLIPIIDTDNVYIATREKEGRKTLYLKIKNSEAINAAIRDVYPDHQEKYMHVSIANVHGGDSYKSVGDIGENDESETIDDKIIVPAVYQQKKKVQRQKPVGHDNPVEFAKILAGRGLDSEQIKNILMKKFNKPEHAVVGIMIGAGISE